jgi:alanine racemase
MAQELSKAAQSAQKQAEVHIKIDSGMNRIGFKPTDESAEAILEISRLPNLTVTGVFSHLAMSESRDTSLSYQQYEKYKYVTDALKAKGLDFVMHMCNSGGILNNPYLHLDMVRPGIILYGSYPSEETKKLLDLKPAMTLKAKISHTGEIEAGESVGYDRTFYTKRKTRVGTIILGYADGYPSALSNKGSVIAGNGYAPIIGQICMDQMMIDITDMPDVNEEDEVILFGKKGGLEIKIEQLSLLSETKHREILCLTNLGKRVPRVYIKDNEIIETVIF